MLAPPRARAAAACDEIVKICDRRVSNVACMHRRVAAAPHAARRAVEMPDTGVVVAIVRGGLGTWNSRAHPWKSRVVCETSTRACKLAPRGFVKDRRFSARHSTFSFPFALPPGHEAQGGSRQGGRRDSRDRLRRDSVKLHALQQPLAFLRHRFVARALARSSRLLSSPSFVGRGILLLVRVGQCAHREHRGGKAAHKARERKRVSRVSSVIALGFRTQQCSNVPKACGTSSSLWPWQSAQQRTLQTNPTKPTTCLPLFPQQPGSISKRWREIAPPHCVACFVGTRNAQASTASIIGCRVSMPPLSARVRQAASQPTSPALPSYSTRWTRHL